MTENQPEPFYPAKPDFTTMLHLISIYPSTQVMTNLDSVLKSRDITLPTKVHIVKAIVFPVVMYEIMGDLDHKEG